MSQRVKRPNRTDDGSVPTKRRKRPTVEEEEAASLAAAAWQPRPFNDLKSIYNRTATEAPAELFRKDLISAMKLPDSEPLASDEYWVIVDQWKQEWERGVQVPVNPDSLPEPCVTVNQCASTTKSHHHEFKMPKNKYIRITKDENFQIEEHILSTAPTKSEAACSYDLDECDMAWLKLLNGERAAAGMGPVSEEQLERVIERLETNCWDKIQQILRNEEGLGIEYDENVICDVCRSPDSEEGNEMVFCDSCNICVHQACYGITRIPDGQWLCGTCAISQRPECVLCPNKGGAMKATRSGQKWAHVSCALWIPEVSIGCVEKMEPITKISSIPQSRWALICVLCRERVGACIQCSVKTCKTAYHVTCAFKHGLEMRAIIEDENADDGVKLRSYCEKHSKTSKKEKSICSGSDDDDSKRKKRKDMTSEEKNQARAARLQEIEAEFDKHVNVKDVTVHMNVDTEALHYIYNYWKLKRRAGHNKPLLPPKSEDVDMLSHKQEQADLEKMKMFVQLRQDLERVRNLCYMVSRREKLSRTFFRMREQTFHKQAAVLASAGNSLSSSIVQAVIEANHGPSIYDRLYSHNDAEDHTKDFDVVLARIAGIKSPNGDESSDEKKLELNGLLKGVVKENPYKKLYFNGSSKRRSASLYGSSCSASSSTSSSDERSNKERIVHHHSSTDDEKPSPTPAAILKKKKHNSSKTTVDHRKKHISSSSSVSSSSSEENVIKSRKKDWNHLPRSRLQQVERELGVSGSDSDELMPIRASRSGSTRESQKVKAISSIYSDSDSSDVSMKNAATSDSQQNRLRTKAAVKEFSQKLSVSSKSPTKSSPPETKKKTKSKETPVTIDKKDYVPSDLIVPQRQAAKKATENLKSTSTSRVKEPSLVSPELETKSVIPSSDDNKTRTKLKSTKTIKDTKQQILRKESKHFADVFDIEKEFDKDDNMEILSYVPQRQAAKKAAEHIKSGLGKPQSNESAINLESSEKIKIDSSKVGRKTNEQEPPLQPPPPEKSPAKFITAESKRKSSSNSSTSSSSTSSTDSSTSSSSDSEEEMPKQQTAAQPRSESLFSSSPSRDQTKRTNTKDWPFLDKAAKSTARSSYSDSSGSSRPSSPITIITPNSSTIHSHSKTDSSSRFQKTVTSNNNNNSINTSSISSGSQIAKPGRRLADKRPKTPEREESFRSQGRSKSQRPAKGRTRTNNSSDRIRNTHVGSGDIIDSQPLENRKGKSNDEVAESIKKEITKSDDLFSSIRKEDKKLNDKIEPELRNLEQEILERKAGRDNSSNNKSRKSSLDRLLDKKLEKPRIINEKVSKSPEKLSKSPEKPLKSPEKLSKSPEKLSKSPEKLSKSPVKENKEPPVIQQHENKIIKKSPTKNKSIEDIFASKICDVDKKVKLTPKHTRKQEEAEDESSKLIVFEENRKVSSAHLEPKFVEKAVMNCELSKDVPSELEDKKQPQNLFGQGRSIFSPPHVNKDSDLLDFDILDDGFGISKDEEIMKGPLSFSFGNVPLFKEDSKEDSARETLNLVEKLRMELSKKSTSTYDIDDSVSVASSTKNESDRLEMEQIVPNDITDDNKIISEPSTQVNVEIRVDVTDVSTKSISVEQERLQQQQQQPQDFNKYAPCDTDVPIENNKSISNIQQLHSHLDHSATAQADERWVPPSENYSEEQQTYNQHNNTISTPYVQQYSNNHQLDLRIQDELLHKNSSPIHDRRISQTPYLEQSSMDCMASPSPYADMHPQAKWADSQVMPIRRSSSSSAASTSSSCSRRNDVEDEVIKRPEVMVMNHPTVDMPFGVLPHPPPFPDAYPPFSEQSQFVSPVSLFPPPNINTQIPPFPSPGAAMFPPTFGAAFPTPHSVIPPLPKPVEDSMRFPCTATFTSSQHNMALTAAMVNLPPLTPTPKEPTTPMEKEEPPTPSPTLSNSTPTSNRIEPSPNPSLKSNSVGKKSPSKPTRTSARFISQQTKSPNKSPGKSPRQEISSKSGGTARGRNENKRNSGRGASGRTQSQAKGRGRGRGRGRSGAHSQHNDFDFTSTIHNKLVGTVYDLDFDDEISNDNMTDLKSMRERRKSSDIHDRKSDPRDSSQSPKFASPSSQTSSHKNRTYNADLRDLRPPTPISEGNSKIDSPISHQPTINDTPQTFPDIVQPVLPGPVDMRTYNSNFESQTYSEANLLGAFASGTAESQVHEDIDEDFEKELHTALTGGKKLQSDEQPLPEISNNNIKVSLSDSRNQLKVKIKGPIANYTSSVPTLPPSTVDTTAVSNISASSVVNNVISNASVGVNSGTSNLRRMRKKELLRQYWTQENMDDSASVPGIAAAPAAPPISRTIITIPKAVASMTSIPTRDDYRDYRTGIDDVLETKIRKENKARPGALSRELKQLDLTIDDEGMPERRRSIGSTSGNVSIGFDSGNKRRGRPVNKSLQPPTPKLKIKIGGNSIVGGKFDDRRDRIRPPKKRLATIAQPSVEDLRRESMKFRKMVMAGFDEEKRKKKDKSGKHKKRKAEQVQIISKEGGANPTKLIIRFGSRKAEGGENNSENKQRTSGKGNNDKVDLNNCTHHKVTPIKLKLSRCQAGSGYVMKTDEPNSEKSVIVGGVEEETVNKKVPSPPPAPPPPPDPDPPSPPLKLPEPTTHTPTSLPLNKDCEVR